MSGNYDICSTNITLPNARFPEDHRTLNIALAIDVPVNDKMFLTQKFTDKP